MDRETKEIRGWRAYRFSYGSLSVAVEAPIDSELATQLEQHIEELAYGGWIDRKPTLDDYEGN